MDLDERMQEYGAARDCAAITAELMDQAKAKSLEKNAARRRELWDRLSLLARDRSGMANGLLRKRAPAKPKAVPTVAATGQPITVADVEEIR